MIQVELTDTFKSVHKTQSSPGILIRPEFYGHTIEEGKVAWKDPQPALVSKDFGKLTYSFFPIPEEPLSAGQKACQVIVREGAHQSKEFSDD